MYKTIHYFLQHDHSKKGKLIEVEDVNTEEAKNDCLGRISSLFSFLHLKHHSDYIFFDQHVEQ